MAAARWAPPGWTGPDRLLLRASGPRTANDNTIVEILRRRRRAGAMATGEN